MVALVAVAVIVLRSGSSYQIKAIFQNASQIVTGDTVDVAGNPIGSVSDIALTPNGQAQLTLTINNSTFEPLREGTEATVRQASLSGIANRYIDLRLGPATAPTIPNNGVIGTDDTTSAVDLDQLFNTLDAPTIKGLQNVIQGSATQYAGRGKQAQAAWEYLNPAVASSARAVRRDQSQHPQLHAGSSSSRAIWSRTSPSAAPTSADSSSIWRPRPQAFAAQQTALGESIQRLPCFMRLANTTFVNLRTALDALTPLVNASKPVAPKLEELLVQLRPLAEESVPDGPRARERRQTTGTEQRPDRPDQPRRCRWRRSPSTPSGRTARCAPGRFPRSTVALNDFTPELAVARPYAVDLTGWFEGFSHPGTIDANGGASRVAATLGVLSATDSALLASLPAAAAADQGRAATHRLRWRADRVPGGPLSGIDRARRAVLSRRAASRATRARCRPDHETDHRRQRSLGSRS